MTLPHMFRLRQRFPRPRVSDVASAVQAELSRVLAGQTLLAGQSVAITAGSRGIANIPQILQAVVQFFRQRQLEPFLVPAMGSHGGATASGQTEILHKLGITRESTGADIRSSLETTVVGVTPLGIPVHIDRLALAADHICVVNRIKAHTDFDGEVESGLHKMMLIGLGKMNGAQTFHRAAFTHQFQQVMREAAALARTHTRLLCGLAILENAYDETAQIEAVLPADMWDREREWLQQSKRWMGRLPFDHAHLLIVDRIGKNISGSGMDTNVIGRKFNFHAGTDRDEVRIDRIFVRSLTPQSQGNATGLGMAEFTNRRTVEQIDLQATRSNCETGGRPALAMIPIAYDRDVDAIAAALRTIGTVPTEQSRVIHIRDTLHLFEMDVSTAYVPLLAGRDDLEALSPPRPLTISAEGHLSEIALTPLADTP